MVVCGGGTNRKRPGGALFYCLHGDVAGLKICISVIFFWNLMLLGLCMFRSRFWLLAGVSALSASLAGCAVTIPVQAGPNGQPAKTVFGDSQGLIYQEASRQCPHGYNIINSEPGSFMLRASMTIQCKQPVVVMQEQPASVSACPPGYRCTPVKPVACPPGYTCQPQD